MNGIINQPLRSGEPGTRNWERTNKIGGAAEKNRNEIYNARDALTPDEKDGFDGFVFHPFKIYSFPICLRANGVYSNTGDWLKFRVHGGRYQSIKVLNTDVHDTNSGDTGYPKFPDSEVPLSESEGTEVSIPANTAAYWFWVDCSNTAAPLIKSGANGQAVSGNIGDPANSGWTTCPTPDSTHIPIGYVDVNTDKANHNAIIRQLVRADLLAIGNSGNAAAGTKRLVYKKSFGDYIHCTDPAAANAVVAVAKQWHLRNSMSNCWIYGTLVNYAYPKNPANWDTVNTYTSPNAYAFQVRQANVGNISQLEGYVPQYIPPDPNSSPVQAGMVIYAIPLTAGDGVNTVPADNTFTPNTQITWLDSTTREWVRFSDQSLMA